MNEQITTTDDYLYLTAEIVASYVSSNTVAPTDLARLISDVHTSLSSLGKTPVEEPVKPEPAVSVRKSVTDDYIICLEDGKKFKSLKRHLRTHYDMSPDEYRTKWGLPADYPMVAPSYSAVRSRLARDSGLGRIEATTGTAPSPAEKTQVEVTPARRVGRPSRKAA